MQITINRLPQLVSLAFAIGLLLAAVSVGAEQDDQGDRATDPASNAEYQREMREALDWLDRYLTTEVLFDRQDIARIREEVAEMSPDQLREWLDRTRQIRARLESPEWARTREFLRDFLSKQAMYSDEEIEEFRKNAAEMSPEELTELLDRVEEKHASISGMFKASEEKRADSVESRRKAMEIEKERRKAALDARDRYVKQQASAQSSAARYASRSNKPLFGSTQSQAVRARPTYRPYAPLITSREVAHETVRRSVLGRYRRGW
jgi:hypothetical protein